VLLTAATLGPAGVLAVVVAGLAVGAVAAALLWRAVARAGDRHDAREPGPVAAHRPGGPAPARPPAPPLPSAAPLDDAPAAPAPAAEPPPPTELPGGATGTATSAEPAAGRHQDLYNAQYSEQLHRLDLLRVRIASHLAAGTGQQSNGHAAPPPAPPPEDRP
jgi:hypothetical protein